MIWFTVNFILTTILYSIISIILGVDFNNNKTSNYTSPPNSKYSNEETHAIEMFRPMVQDICERDYQKTDTYLIRWLRACDLDLIETNIMLRESQKWRKENRMDNILNEEVFDIKGKPCVLEGTDLEGNPLAIVSLIGHYDVRKYVMAGHRHDLERYMNQFLEKTETKIRDLANSTGKDITQAVTLVDTYGFNVKQHACIECLRMYMDFFRNFEKYFPELNRYVVIVNAPVIAKPFIDMLKPLLSKNSQRAVKIFGMDKKEWSTFLLSIISPDQLPIQFGGSKKLNS